ncbi:MAG TPA: VOC family protein [Gemmatimonadaceae bacterium]|nr:VOC family protein [Gemmatimonadaceae bacterium]
MFNHHDAMATVAVKDVKAARQFYEATLGLTVADESMGAITYQSGKARLILYESQFAGTNQATTVTWRVGDEIEAIVKSLGGKGVKFEHYDFPDVKRQGDIHLAGNLRMAWFRDPAGNILALVSG